MDPTVDVVFRFLVDCGKPIIPSSDEGILIRMKKLSQRSLYRYRRIEHCDWLICYSGVLVEVIIKKTTLYYSPEYLFYRNTKTKTILYDRVCSADGP